MRQKPSGGKKIALLSLVTGGISFVAGILNNFFTTAVTYISLVGLIAGLVGIVLAVIVRKSSSRNDVSLSSVGLVLAIIGLIWNLSFFVVCSVCLIGNPNMV